MMSGDTDNSSSLGRLLALTYDERLAHVRAAHDAEAMLLGLVDEAVRVTAAEPTRGLVATEAVLALADACDAPTARARARRARARALSYAGRLEEALVVCHEAVGIATDADIAIEAGRARLASMHALVELGRLDEAIAVGSRARDLFMSIHEPTFAARADINLGIAHQRRDQPATALECFTRARPHLADDHAVIGHLDNSRGEALVALNRFTEAEAAFESALAAFEAAGAALTAAIAEGNLADLAAREGRLQRALYFFEGARRHLERDPSPGHLARLLAEQAEAKSVLGLPADALDEYERALPELDRCGLALEAARARHGMGLALLRLGRHSEAVTSLAAAAASFGELGHRTAQARVDLVRAELALSNGQLHEARRIALRALSVLDDRPADAAAARLLLGRIATAIGDDATAMADLDAALAAARRFDLAPLTAAVLEARGRLHRRRGMIDPAVDDLSGAVTEIERVRGALQADRFRDAFLGDRAATHEALIEALIERGSETDRADAFGVAEQVKSRLLLDQIRSMSDEDPAGSIDPAALDPVERRLRDELKQARSELNALYSRLADDRAANGAGEARTWRDAVHHRENQIASIESRLATMRGGNWIFAEPLSAEAVIAALAPGEMLVEYFSIGDSMLAFTIDDREIGLHRASHTMSDVRDALQRMSFQFNRALRPGAVSDRRAGRLIDDARRVLGELHEVLLAPLAARLEGVRRLTIVPHGPLHVVPFHALWDGAQYLVERVAVCSVPSASLAVHLGTRRGEASCTGLPLVLGVADETAPRIEDEARAVADLIDCPSDRLLIGDRGTSEIVTDLVADAPLIHFACHGRYSIDHPNASGLRLADRWLTVRDIASLRLSAELVTLSGCETGLSTVTAGDELLGLLRAFFIAGARSLLVSLWRVDDETAREFAARVYRSWHSSSVSPSRLSEQIRQAQLEILAEYPHPAHWAPFTLVGRS